MIRLAISSFLIFVPILFIAQSNTLPEGSGFFIKAVSQDRIDEKKRLIYNINVNDLDTSSKWSYYLTKSSIQLYSDFDSSLYYFEKAYFLKPIATCNIMTASAHGFASENSKGLNTTWYLEDLPNFDEIEFLNKCQQDKIARKSHDDKNNRYIGKSSRVIPLERKSTTVLSERIRKADQNFRSKGDMVQQQKNDQINRDLIDSLYSINGSLDAFTEVEIYQFSIVAHHSEDCDWVYKWAERFIALYDSGYKGSSFLGPLIERMFDENEGYCTTQDPQKRNYYIFMLKNKYPNYFQNRKID